MSSGDDQDWALADRSQVFGLSAAQLAKRTPTVMNTKRHVEVIAQFTVEITEARRGARERRDLQFQVDGKAGRRADATPRSCLRPANR